MLCRNNAYGWVNNVNYCTTKQCARRKVQIEIIERWQCQGSLDPGTLDRPWPGRTRFCERWNRSRRQHQQIRAILRRKWWMLDVDWMRPRAALRRGGLFLCPAKMPSSENRWRSTAGLVGDARHLVSHSADKRIIVICEDTVKAA